MRDAVDSVMRNLLVVMDMFIILIVGDDFTDENIVKALNFTLYICVAYYGNYVSIKILKK